MNIPRLIPAILLGAHATLNLSCARGAVVADDDAVATRLIVYATVPGVSPSEHYTARVRPAGADAPWQTAFVSKTACKDFGRFDPERLLGKIDTEGYCPNLSGWSHSYTNFETRGPVEVEIAKADGTAIRKATVHPVRYGKRVCLKDGKAFVTLDQPCLVAVDIDGDMRDQDTTRTPGGGWYTGPPLHGLSIFANPILGNKPRLGDPTVYALEPGARPPAEGDWKTLYFLPGIHDIGVAYVPEAGKSYYIPGDALVYGTFYKKSDGHDIRIFGCGTLSGDRQPHPERVLKLPMNESQRYSPITIFAPYNSTVEGITIGGKRLESIMDLVTNEYVEHIHFK